MPVYSQMYLSVKTLVDEVNGYAEKKTTVESAGSRLAEFSRKEDCDVIHNLLMTVQDRYKQLQQCISERGIMLEEVKKNAKQVDGFLHSLSPSMKILTFTRKRNMTF